VTPVWFRRAVAAYFAVYLVIRAPAFWALRNNAAAAFDPVGVLWWLDRPVTGSVVIGAWAATALLAVVVGADWKPEITAPVFATAALLLLTYRSSWGQILWFENLPALHALVVGLTVRVKDDWALRLAAIVTVITYVLAGIAKLQIGGVAWVTDGSLANHIAFSAARLQVLGGTPSPIAGPLLSVGPLVTVAGGAALLIELVAPLALFRRFRLIWIVGAWLMHAAIAASMFVVFAYPLFGFAFLPLLTRKAGDHTNTTNAHTGDAPSLG